MYNGIGLTTPRGSGTNGHVQRNWAFLRPGKKDNSNYRSEEDIKKLDYTLNRPPNKDILDHDRKRKIEVKCLEFEEILEKQGLSSNEIKAKVDSYRTKLMGQGKLDTPKDEFGRITVRDSHQIAEAQQAKNAKLREAFNISEYFVEGSSFDSDRRAKEDLAKSLALQKELDTQRDQAAAATVKEKESSKRYALVRTPSMEQDASPGGIGGVTDGDNTIKRKKKKKTREHSTSTDRKKEKKKKSKKHKKESKPKKSKKLRKHRDNDSDSKSDHGKDSFDEDSETEIEVKKNRKKNRKDKKQRRHKKKELSSSSDKSISNSPLDKPIEYKKRETLKESKSSDYHFRSRSKEKSHKLKETQRYHYEASQDSLNRRSRSDRNKTKLRSNSHNDKNLSSRHSRSNEKNDSPRDDLRDSYQTRSSKARYHSHEKERENRRSRSRQRSKGEIAVERVKSLKRKHSEEYSQKIRESPSLDKRKQCSRTSGHQSVDNQRKAKKSRSRSASVKANFRKKSLTPPPRTLKTDESEKYNTKTFNKQQKLAILNFKDKKPVGNKSRSRTNSRSTSNEASSTDTETSQSRTPSPRKQFREKTLISNNIDTQEFIEEKRKSLSPIRMVAPVKLASTSRSEYIVLDENSRISKPRSASKLKEWLEKSKEKREEHKKLSSSTPPPFKIEKKVLSPRSSRNSSELSYSPARRNPERYLDILEKTKNEKNEKSNIYDKDEERNKPIKISKQSEERECDRKEKGGKSDRNQAKPVVRLQSQSDEDSDVTERNTEKILDEFQESRREKELKELKMLEQLKTGIAAKAKEKIKTIEKMAASTSTSLLSSNAGEVSGKPFKRRLRHSLNDFLAANNVAPGMVATSSPTNYNSISNSPHGAIYPQTLEEIKKEQESVLQLTDISINIDNYNNSNKDNEAQANCKNPLVSANGHALLLSPTTSPLINKDRDFKRERDFRERERETNNFNKDRYLERRPKSSNIYSTGGVGGSTVGGGVIVGGRRNNNNSIILNINHRQQRLNLMCNSGGVGAHIRHPHSHMHPHHHPIHKLINNHHSTTSSCTTTYIANNSSTNPHTFMCNHANNSTNISFNRPSRINNTPLITATQFNNQMLSKQSNSILVNRRDHRTALNLGLSGTPCTNFSNSNLLLTKANTNTRHINAAAVGQVVSGGHHHHHHHHHHHGQNASLSSSGSNPASQITDRILIAASIAAAQRHSLGVVHSAASSVAAVAAANNLNYLQQQNKPKLVIKPFKINDSQPLVAALADSSLVDAIVSKVSTATVAAAESAARRSRSRSRRSRSRNRHDEKTNCGGNSGGCNVDLDGFRRRSTSHSRSSRSSTSSRSRSRSRSHRSSRSHSSQSSLSSNTSRSSSSSSGSSRSGTRSPSIPRRRGSPSFLDRRRITSARKRPVPYHRKLPSDVSSCYCSSCCSRDSSTRSRSLSRDSQSPSRFF